MGIWDRLSRTFDELAEDLLPGDVRDGVEGARVLLERGQPAAAAAALEQVLRVKPDHASALLLLGEARLRAGQPAAAAAAFARAVSARAGFAEAMLGLGEARLAEGQHKLAMDAFRDALAHAGGDGDILAQVYRGMGQAHLAAGDRERAVRELRKALVESPTDAEAAAALAEALLAGPDDALDDARAPLEKAAAAANAPAATLIALGRLELRAGRAAPAQAALERALATKPAPPPTLAARALASLADALVARGDLAGAHRRLLEALAAAPSAELHLRLARVHRAAASPEAALAACEAAAELGAAAEAIPLALDIALDAGLAARAAELAARAPEHPLALAARGAALVDAGESDAARALLTRADAAGEARHAPLLLARLDLATGAVDAAADRARALLARSAADAGARSLLQAARRRQLGAEPPPADFLAALTRLATFARAVPELAPLAADAAAIVDAYDRPLLLTVMGEFSSGKSTFVNALLGAEVAATGITPTTATINILKYGREQRARIVYHDDRERELAWDDVAATLRALTPADAAEIRVVELLYPLETLERVHVVDTPGLNSILPEHEETARRFVSQADAVVWVFSAMQAGKATERDALAHVRAEGKRVLGVVNKIDQAGPDERAQILAHLEKELGSLVEAFVPVSARRALDARVRGDAAALAAAAWPELDRALEERFFTQARSIKRTAAQRRATALASAARARLVELATFAAAHADTLARASAAARADAVLFRKTTVPAEARHLAERLSAAYRVAAREVLDVVRPRRLPFGANVASQADRDYLVALLDRALATLIEPTRRAAHDELARAATDAARAARAFDPAAADALDRAAADALALVDARVFDRVRAYLRGYLRGGSVDDFFTRALPRLELTEDAVYHALVRAAPDLDAELTAPLADAGDHALRALAARLDALAAVADLRRFELDDVAADALARLSSALERA